MNSKGFTLFTALVSLILITLGFILVQSMIESERNSAQTIKTIDEQTEMQNIADLARADALQLFNIGVRYQFERYITDPNNDFYVMDKESANDWDKIVEEFARAELGGKTVTIGGSQSTATEQFAYAMSNYLVSTIAQGTYAFKGYDVRLIISENKEDPNSTLKFKNAISKMTQEGIEDNKLLEPINCTGGSSASDCTIGTFYINLNLNYLTAKEYNDLPQIVVKSISTGRVIKQPILPKGNIRIFVPLRIFKAIWKAKQIALENVFPFSETIKYYGLGMCDADCKIRTNPEEGSGKEINKNFPGTNGEGAYCPGSPGATSSEALKEVTISPALDCITSSDCPAAYATNNAESMRIALFRYIRGKGLAAFSLGSGSSIDPDSTDGLNLWPSGTRPGDIIQPSPTNIETKKIKIGANPTGPSEGAASCEKLSGLEVVLVFKETDKEYMVNQARGESKVYKIKIADNFAASNQVGTCYSVSSGGGAMATPGSNGELSCSENPS